MVKNDGFGGGYYCDCKNEFAGLSSWVEDTNICSHGDRLCSPPDGFEPNGGVEVPDNIGPNF
jgi:hypothetical protein